MIFFLAVYCFYSVSLHCIWFDDQSSKSETHTFVSMIWLAYILQLYMGFNAHPIYIDVHPLTLASTLPNRPLWQVLPCTCICDVLRDDKRNHDTYCMHARELYILGFWDLTMPVQSCDTPGIHFCPDAFNGSTVKINIKLDFQENANSWRVSAPTTFNLLSDKEKEDHNEIGFTTSQFPYLD